MPTIRIVSLITSELSNNTYCVSIAVFLPCQQHEGTGAGSVRARFLLSFFCTGYYSLTARLSKERPPCRLLPGRPSKFKQQSRRPGRDVAVAVAGPHRPLPG